MRRTCIVAAAIAGVACSYVLPATWRSFRADPDDAPTAVTRAFEARGLVVGNWDQGKREITSDWSILNTGTRQIRERYVVTWERDTREHLLTIYVRHEAQEGDRAGGAQTWSTPYHEGAREDALLDSIAKALVEMREVVPPATADGEDTTTPSARPPPK